ERRSCRPPASPPRSHPGCVQRQRPAAARSRRPCFTPSCIAPRPSHLQPSKHPASARSDKQRTFQLPSGDELSPEPVTRGDPFGIASDESLSKKGTANHPLFECAGRRRDCCTEPGPFTTRGEHDLCGISVPKAAAAGSR